MISVDMIEKIQVQFVKPIFEDDFPEKGMKAWLTDIEWSDKDESYKLYFDFKDFEDYNEAYFKEQYYPNIHTEKLGIKKPLYTAKEAGMYNPKYSVYFSLSSDKRDDELFKEEIKEYLRCVVIIHW
jgi:hypothetical protein